MHLPDEPESSPQINIVPMVDVIFVVLTFFILSSLFLSPGAELPVSLPQASTSENRSPQHSLSVTLTVSGELFLGTQPTTLETLVTDVEGRRVGDRSLLIILRADEQVPHGRVVAVMDRLRAIAGIQIGIATEPPN
jgi:biopolymer transport protein ExbD